MRRTRTLLMLIPIAIVTLSVAVPSFAFSAPGRLVSVVPLFQSDDPATCRDIDRSYIQFDAALADENGFEPGRVLSLNNGTLAVLLIVSDVDDDGAATAIDFATSVRLGALIIQYRDSHDVRSFDPPARSGSGLRAPEDNAIDVISFCYRVSIPAPPRAGTAAATMATTPGSSATKTPEPTATVLTFDLSEVETASARAVEIEQTATAAAIDAAVAIATSRAAASEIAATATAAGAKYDATIAAQQDELATLKANVVAAQATADALRATVAAPTVTPAPTETEVPTNTPAATETPSPTHTPAATETPIPTETAEPTPIMSNVVYETSGDNPFADWQPVEGWDLTGATAMTDGSGERGWLVVPVPSGLAADAIVDIEFRVTGGEICPRNFGLAVRGSATGYYATGIEWACDPAVVVWAGAEPLENVGLELGSDWHRLQISVVGSQIQVSIDDVVVVSATDERYPAGNLVALWTDSVGLEIRLVRVSEVSS